MKKLMACVIFSLISFNALAGQFESKTEFTQYLTKELKLTEVQQNSLEKLIDKRAGHKSRKGKCKNKDSFFKKLFD